jgi:hypothetical protein
MLPSGYKTLDYHGWKVWFETNMNSMTDAEMQLLLAYIELRLSELAPGGRNFWLQLIGTDVDLVDPGTDTGTIGGCNYDARASTETGWHYRITDTYEEALETLSSAAVFGYLPLEHSYNDLKFGSSLVDEGADWVIFEIANDGYRLIKNVSGDRSGVIWRKKD